MSGTQTGTFRALCRDLLRSLPLARELARRSIAAQYRQSFTGVLQAFFPAIVTTAWCTMVRHARIIHVDSLETPYPAFVLISMMLWLTFVDALQAPIQALVADQSLLRNSAIPRETVVVGSLGVVIFNFVVKLILVVAVAVWYRLPISATVVLAPLGVIGLSGLGAGIGLFLAPLNFLYRDIACSLQPCSRPTARGCGRDWVTRWRRTSLPTCCCWTRFWPWVTLRFGASVFSTSIGIWTGAER